MGADDVAAGVRAGWLVPEEEGWHRFVWEFSRDPRTGEWVRKSATHRNRVRVLPKGESR